MTQIYCSQALFKYSFSQEHFALLYQLLEHEVIFNIVFILKLISH